MTRKTVRAAEKPNAVHSKRRSSGSTFDLTDDGELGERNDVPSSHQMPGDEIKQPAKTTKRVRFSDPGPNPKASSSTGLTPAFKRTTMIAVDDPKTHTRSRWLARNPPRRYSLPSSNSASLPSPSLSPRATPCFSGDIQFRSLRQTLDPRSKRRLRRNHLSEEMNDIEAEKKSNIHLEQEVQRLRAELESERQCGDGADGVLDDEASRTERIQNLEDKLAILKRERSTTADPQVTMLKQESHITTDPQPNFVNFGQSSPNSSIYSDGDTNDGFMMANFDEDGVFRESSIVNKPQSYVEATTQISLASQVDMNAFRSARLTLEYLFPGENSLGLTTEDPSLILEAILKRLQTLKAQSLLAETSLAASQRQETNLRTQFNAVLQQLDRARIHAEGLSAQISGEKVRGDEEQRKAQKMEDTAEKARNTVKGLEADLDEKQRSVQKLQDALESYRTEVSKLEALVTKLEKEHASAIADVQTKMDETVADLECHVAAEMTGRRAAEKEVVAREERIRKLERLQMETKTTVTEKQAIIRDLENEIAKEHEEREKEMGVLNVKVGQLTSNLEEVKSELKKIERANIRLVGRLEEEKAAGVKAVEEMQAEMVICAEKVNRVKDTHMKDVQSRGAEVAEHQGLLTPVSACRFKDVEGFVEVRRGKARKRPDSGIGMLEEHEDEDLMLDDHV